jgi:hypothetical protein
LGVFSNTTLRKGDYAALYGVERIVSRAEYERDYKRTVRIECDYAFEISTDEIDIGLIKPVAGEGLGSFFNSSYRNKQYPNNCKFVVHGQSVVVVLDIEALPRHQDFLVPYSRPLSLVDYVHCFDSYSSRIQHDSESLIPRSIRLIL